MEAPAKLLEYLCDIRRIAYVWIGPDWRVREAGGALDPWPGLEVGSDLAATLPELEPRKTEAVERMAAGKRFVLRWVERTAEDRRTRFYELNLHRCDDDDGWLCWIIDRSSYGRLKVRIDRYYQELVANTAHDRPSDPFSELDPELTR